MKYQVINICIYAKYTIEVLHGEQLKMWTIHTLSILLNAHTEDYGYVITSAPHEGSGLSEINWIISDELANVVQLNVIEVETKS